MLVAGIAASFGARTYDVIEQPAAITTLTAIEPDARRIVTEIERAGLPRRPVLLRAVGSTLGGLDQAVFDALDRQGVPVRADERYAYLFGEQRVAEPGDVDRIWYVAEEGHLGSILAARPGAELVAHTTPLDDDADAELSALQVSMAAALEQAGRADLVDQLDSPLFGLALERAAVPGIDLDDGRRIAALNARVTRAGGCRCFVVSVPSNDAPDIPTTL